MNTVRKLTIEDVDAFTEISCNSYPWIGYQEDNVNRLKSWIENSIEQFPQQELFGAYRDKLLLGGMCLYDFKMNVTSTIMSVGGIGSVAVDLLHKKEGIAKELVQFSFQRYKECGVPLVTLYPFDAGSYKKMGFGYGSQINQYRVKTVGFPRGDSKQHIEFLNNEDRNEVLNCYNKFFERTNGLTEKLDKGLGDLFDFNENRIVGYRKDGTILGYLAFSFHKHYQYKNDLVIKELVYETPDVLLEFCTFLHTQFDQVERVIIETQDEYFHFLLSDPSRGTYDSFLSKYLETSTIGMGIMYRVVDIKTLFEKLVNRNFGNQNCKMKISIVDTFFESNNGSTIIHFVNGFPTITDNTDYDVEISMDVAEFSSLIMGAVDFKTLIRLGLARLSDNTFFESVQNVFRTEQKPMCLLQF
ncbi:GNAT family N-acetyltransferase [Paenibacillus terrigena]|uniref:GNAT family N-acetyltransferase n=1 Tax=Paenibacillus terrigena TaxID=369333 RepID=UPI000376E96A|nr:GNAT family N-acetyltransferase [Paenibacillus terrigena]